MSCLPNRDPRGCNILFTLINLSRRLYDIPPPEDLSSVFPFFFRLSLEQISGSETATRSCERVAITIFHRREQAITTPAGTGLK